MQSERQNERKKGTNHRNGETTAKKAMQREAEAVAEGQAFAEWSRVEEARPCTQTEYYRQRQCTRKDAWGQESERERLGPVQGLSFTRRA